MNLQLFIYNSKQQNANDTLNAYMNTNTVDTNGMVKAYPISSPFASLPITSEIYERKITILGSNDKSLHEVCYKVFSTDPLHYDLNLSQVLVHDFTMHRSDQVIKCLANETRWRFPFLLDFGDPISHPQVKAPPYSKNCRPCH